MEGKGSEGRRNRIAGRVNVVPGGEFSPIYLHGVNRRIKWKWQT